VRECAYHEAGLQRRWVHGRRSWLVLLHLLAQHSHLRNAHFHNYANVRHHQDGLYQYFEESIHLRSYERRLAAPLGRHLRVLLGVRQRDPSLRPSRRIEGNRRLEG
jgi:hypothetical protein